MTVTCVLKKYGNLDFSIFKIEVEGMSLAGITEETGKDKAEAFAELCRQHEGELVQLLIACEEHRDINIELLKAGKQGKDWPCFRQLDKLKDKLLSQAGIVDT